MANPPKTLYTPRLVLILNDPDDEEDCLKLIRIYNDPAASLGGNARVGINTVEDVRAKHREHGPRAEYCTQVSPPKGLFHFVHVKDENGDAGELLGFVSMSFRPTMPYPDLGYGLFRHAWGKGYASEAGRESLKWWQDEIGVKEVWYDMFHDPLRTVLRYGDVTCRFRVEMKLIRCLNHRTGALEKNTKSQRCAENIGFVRCGEFDVCFGKPGQEIWMKGVAYILPGMTWKTHNKDGTKPRVVATVGVETEKQRNDPLHVG